MTTTVEDGRTVANILIVDDHPANLLALEAVLEPLGQRIVRASSGREALERLLDEEFAMVLLDVQMPGLDGFATAVLIKQNDRTREVPILFLTAIHRDATDAARGYAHGAVDYITKPFDPDVLRDRVAELLDRWRDRTTHPASGANVLPAGVDGTEGATSTPLGETPRARLRETLEQMALPVALLRGPAHVVEFASASFRALMGGPELVDTAFVEALPSLHDADAATLVEAFDRAFARGTSVTVEELTVADGRSARLALEPTRDLAGRVDGVLVTATDVTEQVEGRRRAEQRLATEQSARRSAEAANQRKDEVLATVSHELRAPLNAILGWTNILRQGGATPERQAHALEVIDRNARAQARLIEDLLDVSRVVAGGLRLAHDRVDLASTVRDAVDALQPSADAKGVRLGCTVNEPLGEVLGDVQRLRQVVTNLVSNAVKFTPRGGRIRVTARRVGDCARILVEDSGAGIEPEFLPHVFDPFRQGSDGSREGLGLGLAIVQRLVALHGGTVRAESIGPGGGATFEVTLPVAPGAGVTETIPASQRSGLQDGHCPNALAGLRVLIVDDEPDAREWVAAALSKCDAQPLLAGNAIEGFARFRRDRPDIVLSDIVLPGEDGYTFMRRIRALPAAHGGRTPSLAVTAAARPEDRLRALAAGFNAHLAKPVEPAQLLPLVGRLASRTSVTD